MGLLNLCKSKSRIPLLTYSLNSDPSIPKMSFCVDTCLGDMETLPAAVRVYAGTIAQPQRHWHLPYVSLTGIKGMVLAVGTGAKARHLQMHISVQLKSIHAKIHSCFTLVKHLRYGPISLFCLDPFIK